MTSNNYRVFLYRRAKNKAVTLVAIIFVIISISSCNLSEKHSNSIIKSRIDSLISWNDEDYRLKPNEAFEVIERCKTLAIETANPEIIGNVLNKEASFLKHINQYAKSILIFKQAAKLYSKSNNLNNLGNTYINLADIYKIIGEYSKSLDYCSKSFEIFQKLKNSNGIKRCYRIMGSDYKYLEDYDKSLLFYQKSLSLSQKNGTEENIADALNNLGTAYAAMGNDSAAYMLYQQCFDIFKKTNNYDGLSLCYNNLGSILMRRMQYDKAFTYFKLALKHPRQTGNKRRENLVLYNIGDYYSKKNEFDSSLYYYNQSLKIASKYGLKERMSSCYEALSKNYLKNKMPYEAYDNLLKYNQIRDTVLSAQKDLETAKSEAKLDAYKEQLQSINDKQKQKLTIAIYALSVLILTAGFIYLFKRQKQSIIRQKKYNQELVEEKSRMEEDLSDRNKELISYSLQIAQQQEIDKVLAERIQIEIDNSSGETKKKLTAILNNINVKSHRINIWDDFELRFNQVNEHFYQNLLEKHPSLSQNEIRLCAFLKLNLNTKEITIITGQSPHSINVARTRLRKKLGLANSCQNLFDFFQHY